MPGLRKRNFAARLHVALLYPNTYPVAIASVGFQILYRMLSLHPDVQCERFFLPGGRQRLSEGKQSALGRREKKCLFSLEEGRPLSDFDVIAVSAAFEPDLFNLAWMLHASGIPPLARERGTNFPLVIAGGPLGLMNPEPLGAMADAVCVSEAEPALPPFIELLLSESSPALSRNEAVRDRKVLLDEISQLDGWYVPSGYELKFHHGIVTDLYPREEAPAKIRRLTLPAGSDPGVGSILVTRESAFPDMALVETGRGCPYRCRFCFATAGYGPVRFRAPDMIAEEIHRALSVTDLIGLVGISVGNLPDLDEFCREFKGRGIRFSVSSLRLDRITQPLVELLAEGGCRSLAVSIDGASQRVRDAIAKDLKQDAIIDGIKQLAPLELENLKIYLMFGLPGETLEDLEEAGNMLTELQKAARMARINRVTVSLTPFVPKPMTPFEREPMDTVPVLKKKLRVLKKVLPPGVVLQVGPGFQEARVQAALSLGDRRCGEAVVKAVLAGATKAAFRQALHDLGLSLSDLVHTCKSPDAFSPWSIIDCGQGKH